MSSANWDTSSILFVLIEALNQSVDLFPAWVTPGTMPSAPLVGGLPHFKGAPIFSVLPPAP